MELEAADGPYPLPQETVMIPNHAELLSGHAEDFYVLLSGATSHDRGMSVHGKGSHAALVGFDG